LKDSGIDPQLGESVILIVSVTIITISDKQQQQQRERTAIRLAAEIRGDVRQR